jgi:hypothetical protein
LATMFLGNINTGSWPSTWGGGGESQMIQSYIVVSSEGLGPESDCSARPRSNCTVNYRPILLSGRAPHIKKHSVGRQRKKIWSCARDRSPTPRLTGRLIVVRELTSTSTSGEVQRKRYCWAYYLRLTSFVRTIPARLQKTLAWK